MPHPAYQLGWGPVSCMACIFGDRHQWASVRALDPQRFRQIAHYEAVFGKTIKRGQSVVEQADSGRSFVDDAPQELIERALGGEFPASDFFLPEGRQWTLPAGAFKRCGGPS